MIDTYRCKAGAHGVSDPSVERKQRQTGFTGDHSCRFTLALVSSEYLAISLGEFRGHLQPGRDSGTWGDSGGVGPKIPQAPALPSMQRFHHGKSQPNVCVRTVSGLRRDVYLLGTELETPDVHLKREREIM